MFMMFASEHLRKCVKCHISAKNDDSEDFDLPFRFHRFPLPDKHGTLRARVWAEYCYPTGDWSTEESLRSLHHQHKMLCSNHFDDNSYTSSSRLRLNNFAIPIGTENILLKLRQEESSTSSTSGKAAPSEAPAKNTYTLTAPANALQPYQAWHTPSDVPSASISTAQDQSPSSPKDALAKTSSKDALARASSGDTTTLNLAQASVTPTNGNTPRQTLKPRGKRAGKLAKRRRQTATASNQPDAKKTRLQDTFLPPGNQQCAWVRPSQIIRSNASAAGAFKANELCVAVMMEPFQDLSADQAKVLSCQLFRKMEADYLNPALYDQMVTVAFQGKTHHSEGVLKLWCKNDETLAYLRQVIADLDSPISGTMLVVKSQSKIPRRLLCGLNVPMSPDGVKMEIDNIRRILTVINENYNVGAWSLMKHEWQTVDNLVHVYLLLRIPEKDVATIFAEERKVNWIMGTIYLRVLEGTGAVRDKLTTVSAQEAEVSTADEPNTQQEPAQQADGTVYKNSPFAQKDST